MSEYSYHDRPRHQHRTRGHQREPRYMSETTYREREGRDAAARNLAYRPGQDDVEEIPRKFPPPGAESRQKKYREDARPRRGHGGYDHDYDVSRDSGRPSRDYDYSSDDNERRPKPQRRKSVVDNLKGYAKASLGVLGATTGRVSSRSPSRGPRKERLDRDDNNDHGSRHREHRRSHRYNSSERSQSQGEMSKNDQWKQAAKAAVVAGAVEAFRSRKTGPWNGAKGQRIATAALGAAGIDSFVDNNNPHHGKRDVARSALGGLVANRLANGSRDAGHESSRSSSRSRSRSRSFLRRSRSRGPSASSGREGGGDHTLKRVASAGVVLAVGKALYKHVRSKSRGAKGRNRSRSTPSEDIYVPSRSRRNQGYAERDRSTHTYSQAHGLANQDRSLATTAGAGVSASAGALTKGTYDSSDSESTTDMEQQRNKLRGKGLITAGLATVATIQAARGVYTSMAASDNRHKLISKGEIAPQEARRLKAKSMLQDAVALGIASLGIMGAFSKWKEMNAHRYSVKQIESRRNNRRKMRRNREKAARQNASRGMNGNGIASSYSA